VVYGAFTDGTWERYTRTMTSRAATITARL
jgi:hypothetical protein